MNWEYVSQIINLTQTTSASYLLMSSLDISRRNLALRGKESFAKVSRMAEYAREEINAIGGFYAYGKDMINGSSVYDFDVTKLSVYTRDIGLAGIEVYDLLRDEYDIQIELGDIANILAYISIGDRILCRKKGCSDPGDRRDDLRRICHVLSTGHSDSGSGRDDHKRNY